MCADQRVEISKRRGRSEFKVVVVAIAVHSVDRAYKFAGIINNMMLMMMMMML